MVQPALKNFKMPDMSQPQSLAERIEAEIRLGVRPEFTVSSMAERFAPDALRAPQHALAAQYREPRRLPGDAALNGVASDRLWERRTCRRPQALRLDPGRGRRADGGGHRAGGDPRRTVVVRRDPRARDAFRSGRFTPGAGAAGGGRRHAIARRGGRALPEIALSRARDDHGQSRRRGGLRHRHRARRRAARAERHRHPRSARGRVLLRRAALRHAANGACGRTRSPASHCARPKTKPARRMCGSSWWRPTAPCWRARPHGSTLRRNPAGLALRAGEADRVETLMEHGNKMISVGYFAGARAYFERAAEAGSGEAALAVGATYDPGLHRRARHARHQARTRRRPGLVRPGRGARRHRPRREARQPQAGLGTERHTAGLYGEPPSAAPEGGSAGGRWRAIPPQRRTTGAGRSAGWWRRRQN